MNTNVTAKCVACGKHHSIVVVLSIGVMMCTLIKDLIYLNGVTVNKESREIIKKELGL
jgi:uncharacterized membrane protein